MDTKTPTAKSTIPMISKQMRENNLPYQCRLQILTLTPSLLPQKSINPGWEKWNSDAQPILDCHWATANLFASTPQWRRDDPQMAPAIYGHCLVWCSGDGPLDEMQHDVTARDKLEVWSAKVAFIVQDLTVTAFGNYLDVSGIETNRRFSARLQ